MTVRYQMVIDRIPDEYGGGYAAFFPDLPGCMSDGESPAEAAENATDALRCWIEAQVERGAPVPEPGAAQAEYTATMETAAEEHRQVCAELAKAKARILALENDRPQGWKVRLPRNVKQAAFG